MTEPVTTNLSLIVPNTGDLVGAWGTSALNPNFQSIDTKLGGVTTISLSSNTTILLSVPATTGVWPGGNPSQSMNSCIKFTGAQTGSATIQFTLPGFYIIDNRCTGTTSVRLSPASGGGNSIGAIPGRKHQVFFDGTDMDYVDVQNPGAALDLHTNTTVTPPWMNVCTIAPYLVKDGTVYSVATYPALAQLLGSTFGGNGATTFGVPDERARFRLAQDAGTTARVTSAISGINSGVFGSSGGDQRIQSHTHTNTLTDPSHFHTSLSIPASSVAGGSVNVQLFNGNSATNLSTNSANSGVSITNTNVGTGSSQNMPPCIVSFLALVKT